MRSIHQEDPLGRQTVTHNIPGLEHLTKADLVVLFSRLISLPDNQLDHVYKYLDSGKPIIGIRTANHGFLGFDYKKDGKKINFGEEVLGGSSATTTGAGRRIRPGHRRRGKQRSPRTQRRDRHLGADGRYRTYKRATACPPTAPAGRRATARGP